MYISVSLAFQRTQENPLKYLLNSIVLKCKLALYIMFAKECTVRKLYFAQVQNDTLSILVCSIALSNTKVSKDIMQDNHLSKHAIILALKQNSM
jgi:hypothetical protein